jgi:hypothetical protein
MARASPLTTQPSTDCAAVTAASRALAALSPTALARVMHTPYPRQSALVPSALAVGAHAPGSELAHCKGIV